MDKRIKENRDQLLDIAKVSKDPTVQKALNKLLFTVSLAHDKEYIALNDSIYYHSGCTITIPAREHQTIMQLIWNNEKIQIFSIEYKIQTFNYGNITKIGNPLPGIVLIEEKNI